MGKIVIFHFQKIPNFPSHPLVKHILVSSLVLKLTHRNGGVQQRQQGALQGVSPAFPESVAERLVQATDGIANSLQVVCGHIEYYSIHVQWFHRCKH